MSPEAEQLKSIPTYQPDLRDVVIQSGDHVLVQLSNGDMSSVKVDFNACGLTLFSSSCGWLTWAQNRYHQEIWHIFRE